jgi:hypothetical protein
MTKPEAKLRILPAESRIVVYPEHGTGRTAKLATCHHCGGKPLILRRCERRRTCAVCARCGFHHHMRKAWAISSTAGRHKWV